MTKLRLVLLATTAVAAMPFASSASHAQTAPIVVAQQGEVGPDGKPKPPPKGGRRRGPHHLRPRRRSGPLLPQPRRRPDPQHRRLARLRLPQHRHLGRRRPPRRRHLGRLRRQQHRRPARTACRRATGSPGSARGGAAACSTATACSATAAAGGSAGASGSARRRGSAHGSQTADAANQRPGHPAAREERAGPGSTAERRQDSVSTWTSPASPADARRRQTAGVARQSGARRRPRRAAECRGAHGRGTAWTTGRRRAICAPCATYGQHSAPGHRAIDPGR